MAFPDEEAKPNDLTPSDGDEGDFSAAFSERSSGSGQEELKPEAAASGDKDQQDAGQAPASEAASEQPAAKPGSPADPWEGLSPEQLEYFKRIQHSEQSQRGRVASLTKKLQTASPPPQQAAPEQERSSERSDDGQGDKPSAAEALEKRLKQAAEDYPDAVGPLAEVITAIRSEITNLSKQVQPIAEDKDAEASAREYASLEKAHPDYREIGDDPSFQSWVKDQPKSVVAMANSWDAQEVSLALTLFKTERDAAIRLHGGDQQKSATDAKRERQLEATKVIQNKGVPASSGVPDDYSSGFKAAANRKR